MIEARGLRKTFARRGDVVTAVAGFDVDVGRGEIVGLLGPNGAGKTTTLRMLATLLAPTAGEAVVAGCDLLSEPQRVRRRIGYVAQGGVAAPEARPLEELVDQARLYGIGRGEAEARSRRLLERFALAAAAARPVKTLSGGQRRRLDVAIGLVHDPRLVFLDEPTAGLDPQARVHLWDHIRSLRDDERVTVLLTTHYLDEADALCDRIVIVDNGTIVAEGTPAALKNDLAGEHVTLAFASADEAARATTALSGPLETAPLLDGHRVHLEVAHAHAALPTILAVVALAHLQPLTLEARPATLDDVFFARTGRALRDDARAA